MLSHKKQFGSQADKKEMLKHWGIFLILASILCLLHEWVRFPEWLWTGIGFAFCLLFAPVSTTSRKWFWTVLKFLGGIILAVIVGIGLVLLAQTTSFNMGYIISASFFLFGLILLVWSSWIVLQQDEATRYHSRFNPETGQEPAERVKNGLEILVERIKRL